MLKLPIKSSSQEIILTHKKHKVQSVSQPSLDLTRYLSNYLITYTVPNIVTFTRYLAFWATGTTFLQRKRLLWPELLTTSTCLSIPNLFIADHSCQRQSCSRRCHLQQCTTPCPTKIRNQLVYSQTYANIGVNYWCCNSQHNISI